MVVSFGSDRPANLAASIVLLDTPALDGQLQTLNGNPVTFALVGGDLVGSDGATEVIRIKITGAVTGPGAGQATYTYSATLAQPVKHAVAGSEDSDLLSGVTFRVTDSDGDPADGTFSVTVVDDIPLAANDGPIAVAEDTPVTFSVFGNDAFGADGVDTDNNPAVRVTFTQPPVGEGSVSYNAATGQFTFTPAAGQTGSTSFTYTIIDGDGDSDPATVTLNIAGDSTPQIGTPTNLTVDEDGLPGANVDDNPLAPGEVDSTESLTQSGTVVVSFGSDRPANLAASIVLLDTPALDGQLQTLNGNPVTFALVGGDLVGSDGATEVIRIKITGAVTGPGAGQATYTYSATLAQPVKHAVAGSEDSDLLSGVTFRVTDSDGDPADGTFSVTVVDDIPLAANDGPIAVAEDTPVTFSVFGNDAFGADGVDTDNNPAVRVTFTQPPVGEGSVSYNAATGQFTFTPAAGQTGSTSFTYTIIDGDGDSDPATVTLNIAGDSTPQIGTPTNLTVDEDGLPGANVDDNPLAPGEVDSTESLTQSGTVVVSFGSDRPANLAASIVLLDTPALDGQLQTLNGNPVTFALVGGDLVGSDGATEVIRIKITGAVTGPGAGQATYTYSATLAQPVKHAVAGSEDSDLLSGVTFRVTDSDGDPADGTFSVTVVDDIPLAANDGPIAVAEDTPVTFSVFGNDAFGADGVDTDNNPAVRVTFTQPPVGEGSVSYNAATGQFTFTPAAGQTGSTSFTYTIIDGDGDSDPATVTLNIAGDSTPQIGTPTNLTVDEDGLPGANVDDNPLAPGEVDSTESLTQSGTVVVSFGSDRPANLAASIVLLDTPALDGQLQTLNGNPVTFALVGGDLVGSDGATEVIRIKITGAVTGPGAGQATYTYSATLAQPVKHAVAGSEDSDLLSGVTFRVTDSDGDPADGTFSVTVVDDIPAAALSVSGLSLSHDEIGRCAGRRAGRCRAAGDLQWCGQHRSRSASRNPRLCPRCSGARDDRFDDGGRWRNDSSKPYAFSPRRGLGSRHYRRPEHLPLRRERNCRWPDGRPVRCSGICHCRRSRRQRRSGAISVDQASDRRHR